MITLILIPLFAILNRAAGWCPVEDYAYKHKLTLSVARRTCPLWMVWAKHLTSDGAVAAYAGLSAGLAAWSWQFADITFIGWWAWRAPAWGVMFSTFYGDKYVGTGILSNAVGRIFGDYKELSGAVYGGCRGFLGFLPWTIMLAAYAYYTGSGSGYYVSGATYLVAGLGMGAVYWLAGGHQRKTGLDTGIKRGELAFGAIIGAVTSFYMWGI